TLADAQGLRQPQDIARRQRAGDEAPAARLRERLLERGAERLVEFDLDARQLSQLQREPELHASSPDGPGHERAHVAFDRGERLRNPELQIEMTVIERADGDVDRRAIVFAV